MNDNNKCEDCNDSWQEHETFYILTDLIEELRDELRDASAFGGYMVVSARAIERVADRAEDRLEGLSE